MTDIEGHSEGGSAESQGGELVAREALPSEVITRAQILSEKVKKMLTYYQLKGE